MASSATRPVFPTDTRLPSPGTGSDEDVQSFVLDNTAPVSLSTVQALDTSQPGFDSPAVDIAQPTPDAASPDPSSLPPAPVAAASSSSSSTHVGSIVGLVLGLLILIGVILFGVRLYFIRKREVKTTPARTRVSRLVISSPSNFQHLQSGAHQYLSGTTAGLGSKAADSRLDSSRSTAAPSTNDHVNSGSEANVHAESESSYDRIKQKYSFDLNQLETGLSDQIEAMKSSRKQPPAF